LKKSGTKTLLLVKSNLLIMKKLAALFILVLLFACEAPYKIVETTTTDSTGKQIKIKQKYYQITDGYSVQPSVSVVTSPVLYGTLIYPYIVPKIVIQPNPHYYSYRGRRH